MPVCGGHFPPIAPATPTLQALVNELASVENWHLLGVNLGLQGHQLREIERNYPQDNRRKTETLDFWQRNATNATWEAVVQALCLMDEHVVANAIRMKYGCSSTTTGKYPCEHIISTKLYFVFVTNTSSMRIYPFCWTHCK